MSWIITGKEAGSLGLLDQYGGAAAAYSLRKLSVYNTSPVVRIRRSSDNTEQDFTASQITDGTLTAFCGAGDGFVRTWYDQSGNNRHATQVVTGNQPQVVSSGSVLTPGIAFDGSNDSLSIGSILSSQQFTFFTVSQSSTTSGGNREIISNWDGSNGISSVFLGIQNSTVRFTDNFSSAGSFGSVNQRKILSAISSASNAETFINGSIIASKGSALTTRNFSTSFYIGTQGTLGDEYWFGSIAEIIVYDSNQSANRASIESNINAHYAIY